jgi:hypothetical protein
MAIALRTQDGLIRTRRRPSPELLCDRQYGGGHVDVAEERVWPGAARCVVFHGHGSQHPLICISIQVSQPKLPFRQRSSRSAK